MIWWFGYLSFENADAEKVYLAQSLSSGVYELRAPSKNENAAYAQSRCITLFKNMLQLF